MEEVMYNNENKFIENDIDANVEKRNELIEAIKAIAAMEDSQIDMREVSAIKKRWNRIPSWESAYEQQLEEEFDKYINEINAKRSEISASNQNAKEALIREVEELLPEAGKKSAAVRINELMDEWKAIRSAGREIDEELWQKFSSARKAFFDARHKYFDEMKERFEEVKQIKEELIAKAAEYSDSKDVEKTSEIYQELMQKWKEAGSAGREADDDLWERFTAARQAFFDYRKTYYDELHEVYAANSQKKEALIAEAKEVLAKEEYSKADTEFMKDLNVRWKEIGTCGRYRDERIWRKFRDVMDKYFDGLKKINDEKHENWLKRMEEAKERKIELIEDQKRQIARLEQLNKELLGSSAIEENEARIEDKKEFIAKLEEEIADIEKSIG